MKFLKATAREHLAKAQRNERLSSELKQLPEQYRDWQIIAVFYAAVHLVQAYLRDKTTMYPQTHEERDRLISSLETLRAIYPNYQELKHLSVTARYTCLPTNEFDVKEARQQLAIIRAHVEKLLM